MSSQLKSPTRATADLKFGGKVALKPGHSLMDWIRYGNKHGNLSGVERRGAEITAETLARHNQQHDAWLAIRSKVYNVTPYMDYHPGGVDELMLGAGIDATELFDEIHKWVNVEALLEKCYVGRLKDSALTQRRKSSAQKPGTNLLSVANLNGPLNLPPPAPLAPPTEITISTDITPTYDWYQTPSTVVLVLYTHVPAITHEHVIVHYTERRLLVTTRLLPDSSFFVQYDLFGDVTHELKVRAQNSGKLEVILNKTADQQWPSLGTPGPRDKTIVDTEDLGMVLDRSYTAVLPSLERTRTDPRTDSGQAIYLMIKIYTDGTVTPWIDSLNPGDTLRLSEHDGSFSHVVLTGCERVVLLAAGTGFTPMIRLIDHVLTNTTASIQLMFFNKTPDDILWRDQLESLSRDYPKLKVHHVLSAAGTDWLGLVGRIRSDLVAKVLPPKSSDSPRTLICVCGPTPFTKEAVSLVKEFGYGDESIHAFLG